MRDSQSLLEQLLAFGHERLTVADIHAMLGTASDERLAALVRHLADRNAAGALAEFDAALADGVEVGQLLDQLLGYFRDAMALLVGCPADSLLYTTAGQRDEVAAIGRAVGTGDAAGGRADSGAGAEPAADQRPGAHAGRNRPGPGGQSGGSGGHLPTLVAQLRAGGDGRAGELAGAGSTNRRVGQRPAAAGT